MAENIIIGNIGDGHTFIKSKSQNQNGSVQIKLDPNLGEADAQTSALLCYDKTFETAAQRTSLSFFAGYKDTNSESGRYIDARLPFNAPFELKTAGKYIHTDSGKNGFLVYEIMQHSSKCPFHELDYWPFHDNSINPDSDPKVLPGRRLIEPEIGEGISAVPISGEKPSKNGMLPLTISANHVNKYSRSFPLPKRAVKLDQKTRSESLTVSKENIIEGTLREITSTRSESTKIKLVKNSELDYQDVPQELEKKGKTYDRDKVLQNFKILCEEIKSIFGFINQFSGNLADNDNINFAHYAFQKKNQPKNVANWCSIERTGGKWQGSRHLAICGFRNDRYDYFYLIEIQRRIDLQESYPIIFVRDTHFKKIHETDLLKIRDKISHQMGKVKKDAYKLYQIELIKHQSEQQFIMKSLTNVLRKHLII